jgi:ATP-dependent DNA ligase
MPTVPFRPKCIAFKFMVSLDVVLDGEIVCLNDEGEPEFRDFLFRQREPRFVGFDLLWYEREDLLAADGTKA